MNATAKELKAEAKARGIKWADVQDLARRLREQDAEAKAGQHAARRRAWELYVTYMGRSEKRLPFWRIEFNNIRAWLENTGKDFTHITGYDLIARTIGQEFPEWADSDAAELFDWLLNELYVPVVSLADAAAEALEIISEHAAATAEEVPF